MCFSWKTANNIQYTYCLRPKVEKFNLCGLNLTFKMLDVFKTDFHVTQTYNKIRTDLIWKET